MLYWVTSTNDIEANEMHNSFFHYRRFSLCNNKADHQSNLHQPSSVFLVVWVSWSRAGTFLDEDIRGRISATSLGYKHHKW